MIFSRAICITVFNNEKNILNTFPILLRQLGCKDCLVIVDGGSEDDTRLILFKYKKEKNNLYFISKKCYRAEGRNIAIENADSEIIVMTDIDCIPDKNWFKRITDPFKDKKIDVVAGFYKMTYTNKLQKAESFFLGVLPKDFSDSFFPSTRSIAFRKSIWKRVGGFPEELKNAAEDTVFNYRLIKNNARFARVKNAIVEWGMPETLGEYFKKIFTYSKSDVETKIWFYPNNMLMSHNIRSLFVLLRYIVFFVILTLSFLKVVPFYYSFFILFMYLIYIFMKLFRAFREVDTALIGIPVQIITDFAVILGFISGIINLINGL